MKLSSKGWAIGFLLLTLLILVGIAWLVISVDPFFHYHAPDTGRYFYPLDNQRSQNDGIIRHFAYDGLITGTSMSENFRVSEAEALFGGRFIKVCYEGSTFYETGLAIEKAASLNPNLTTVIRGLDMDMFFDEKDRKRTDLGSYPDYLYDDFLFNDAEYLFNRDILFTRVLPMLLSRGAPGITSFDDYSDWMRDGYTFGARTVYPQGLPDREYLPPAPLSEAEEETIRENIRQNVTDLARRHPQITFYCFFPPYSAAWWVSWREGGGLEKKIAAERLVIEEILTCGNIRLFSFNDLPEITADLNYYKDMDHYGDWINSLILRKMAAGSNQLTQENYLEYLRLEEDLYRNLDENDLIFQEDLEQDNLAAKRAELLFP